jgi:hypothetical protein
MPPEPTKAHRRHMENCSADRCGRKVELRGCCRRHYQQIRKHGEITNTAPSQTEPRPAIIQGDIALIPLGVQAKDGYAIVDVEDAWVAERLWCRDKYGYAVTNHKSVQIKMHQLILGLKGIDHQDGDPRNNRRQNLRPAKQSQNMCNRDIPPNKAGFKGVCKTGNIGGKPYWARISINGRRIYLGVYDTAEAAARAYNKAALKYHGEFARLNELAS